MLIDILAIKHSDNPLSEVIAGPTQQKFINHWANLLELAGWTRVGFLHASASVTFPLGTPITDGIDEIPKHVVGCNTPPGFLSIGSTEYSLYDPFHQVPGTTTACVFVAMDTTFAGTLANLAAAINGGAWFATVTFNGGVSYTLDLVAVGAGPEFNELLISSNGFLSGNAVTAGGGYTMRSAGTAGSAVYDCTMTAADRGGAGDNYLAGILKFDFTINGAHQSYQLLNDVQGTLGFMGALGVGGVAQYTLICNADGFCVFDQPRNNTTHQFRAISLFCMAPYFPTDEVPPSENFIPAYAVTVIGPNQIGSFLSWKDPFMASSTMCLDDVPFVATGFNPTSRALAYRSTQFALHTVYDVPYYLGAYVQFGSQNTNSDPAWVVGKLWDCAVISDYVAADGVLLDSKPFLVIGYGSNDDNQVVTTFLMSCGPTASVFAALGQSSACASAPGNPGSGAHQNTGH